MSETNTLTRAIIEHQHEEGAFAFRVSDTGVFDARIGQFRASAKKGISDIISVYNSHFLAIEIKTGKDTLRPEQVGFMKNVQHSQGFYIVTGTFENYLFQWLDIKEKILQNKVMNGPVENLIPEV